MRSALSITENLARWICAWRQRGLPPEAIESAETFVLDWLASALAGRGTEAGGAVLAYARSQPEGAARVVGESVGRAPETAAFTNGALSHIVEMDDIDRVSVVHPGAVVIPAALAVADEKGSTGRELLSAVVAGYEVAIRFGRAVGRRHYYHFHNTSTCGVFGSAAASAWLLGLDEASLVWALGSAGTTSFGLWQFNAEGAMSKPLHAGQAAANGVRAAELAARGLTGSRLIAEGERGFFAGMAPEARPELVTAGLSTTEPDFALAGVSLKPHASCRHTHAAVDAALSLGARTAGRAILSGRISVYRAARDLCDQPSPRSAAEAKFSLQYCVARALLRRPVSLDAFAPEALEDRGVREVMEKLSVGVDPDLDEQFPARFPARVAVELDDGDRIQEEVAFPLGDPENPLSRSRLDEKFAALASFGGLDREAALGYLSWARRLSAGSRTAPTSL